MCDLNNNQFFEQNCYSKSKCMLKTSTYFVEIARNVTNRVSQLLDAPVLVTDAQGVVITSSDRGAAHPFDHMNDETISADFIRMPLQYQSEAGEIIVGEPYNREDISPRLAQILIELVINQTTHQEQTISQPDLKNRFICDLLHGRTHHEDVAFNQAKQLGLDLAPPRAVILVSATSYVLGEELGVELPEVEQQRRARDIIRSIVSFFHLPNDTICANLGQGKVCVLKATDTKNLGLWAKCHEDSKGLGSSWANLAALKRAADALLMRLRNETGTSIDIGIGRYHPGILGLARSYEDARAALSLGSRFQGHNRVHCLGELGIAAFVGVADENTKVDLAKYLLSPLDHENELFNTLNVFFSENCCPSSTAKQLSIHRNTLSYRLDKIFSLTGLDPRRFDDAVQMRLCMLLRSLQGTQTN